MTTYPNLARLTEIYNDPSPLGADALELTGLRDYLRKFDSHSDLVHAVDQLPSIGAFKLLMSKRPVTTATLIDPTKVAAEALEDLEAEQVVVGAVTFDLLSKRTLQVGAAFVVSAHRGADVMLATYLHLIKTGYTIVSGSSHTPYALALWRKLAKTRGVFVYGWDESTGDTFHTFDRDDDAGFDGASGTTHIDWAEPADAEKSGDFSEEEIDDILSARDDYRLVATRS